MKLKFKNLSALKLAALAIICSIGIISSCEDELPAAGSIPDLTPPSAFFSYKSTTSGYNQIQFTNLSISASEYAWDFGDGGTSTEAEPLYVYEDGEGEYTVSLVARDGNGVTSDTTLQVFVVDELVPAFECKSFECSDRSVWGSFSGSGSPTPPDGSTGAKIESDSHYLDQTIKVTSGVTYNLSFFYVSASSSGTSCGSLLIEDPDNAVVFVEEGVPLTPNASNYVYISYIIKMTANTKNLRFYLTKGDVTGRFDLVEIAKI